MSDDRPVVPTYKREVLQPPPAHLLGNVNPPSPGNGATATNPPVTPSPPFKFDDRPLDNMTEIIINAGSALHRVLVQRINFHESEAKKLRGVLAMFAGSHGGQPTGNVAPSGDDLSELLRIAQRLEDQK